MSLFCMVTVARNNALEWASGIVWLALAFSWIVGFLAIRFGAMRPVYWLLLGFIPVAMIVQQLLLSNRIVYCDAP